MRRVWDCRARVASAPLTCPEAALTCHRHVSGRSTTFCADGNRRKICLAPALFESPHTQNKIPPKMAVFCFAESVGFEPTDLFRGQHISSVLLSATQPTLQITSHKSEI
jgi:hypothetical protein